MTKLKKVLISGFIMMNLMAMVRIHLPMDTKFLKSVYKPVDAYLSFFSIYQDWYMFAPDPTRMNFFLTAQVEFTDGTRSLYKFPRETELTFKEKYIFGEKYRKFVSEGVRKEENSWMWNDTAKFVLRKMKDTHYNKIPAQVQLIRNWDIIPDLQKEFRPHLTKQQNYESFAFYTYKVI